MPLTNTKAMDQIHLLLQGLTPETTEDVLNEITQIVRDTGREIDTSAEAEEFIILNLTDNYVGWSVDDNCWVDLSRATILSARDLEAVTIPDHDMSLAIPTVELRNLNDRTAANLRAALFSVANLQREGAVHDWRWLPVDEREADDMRVAVVWASTPADPNSLAVQYTLTELNQLRMDVGRARITRSIRDRRREQWGVSVGDRLARREAQRALAIPANRQEGEWTTGTIFDPRWQHPAYYDDGTDNFVIRAIGPNGNGILVARTGYAVARSLDEDEEEISMAGDFREMFPDGTIEWDMYDSPYFFLTMIDTDGELNDDADAETYYTLDDAIMRAASLLRIRPYNLNDYNREAAA